jgi:hypothetical protein
MELTDFIARNLFGWQRRLVFPRHLAGRYAKPSTAKIDKESWWITTEEGEVEAWFMPAPVTHSEKRGAVIFTHGNAELIDQWAELLTCYHAWGMSVLLPEYRGYGRSKGTPSQAKIVSDVMRFWDKMRSCPYIDSQRVVLHGRSLGGGVACALASERTPAALVLQSTFTSIRQVAKRYGAPASLILDPFDNLKFLSSSDCPVLIVHGTSDRLIPVSHAFELHKASANSQLVLYDADHNTCPPDWKAYVVKLEAFLKEAHVL